MHELTIADRVWNRACQGGGGSPRAGDSALSALLLFHGAAMNGGVLHAVGCLSPEELTAAQLGYNYFGISGIAALIGSAQEAIRQERDLDDLEPKFDQDYWAAVPDDGTLVNAFTAHFNANAAEFSPLVGS